MALDIQRSMDFGGIRRILNLPDATTPQEPATYAQLLAIIEGLNWKDNVRVATQGNISLTSPGATIDGITMAANDRVLVQSQTSTLENGIYIWNGAAVAMTRSLDANTALELTNAVVVVDLGTSAGNGRRQQSTNFILGTDPIVWGAFGVTVSPATTSSLGTVQLATQSEVNAGVNTTKVVTAETLAASVYATKKLGQNIGDGSATSFVITHNFNTYDVNVEIFRNSGNRDTVYAEVQRTSLNAVTVVVDTAPASNAFRVLVKA